MLDRVIGGFHSCNPLSCHQSQLERPTSNVELRRPRNGLKEPEQFVFPPDHSLTLICEAHRGYPRPVNWKQRDTAFAHVCVSCSIFIVCVVCGPIILLCLILLC